MTQPVRKLDSSGGGWLMAFAGYVFKIAAPVFGLVVVYLLYVIFSGQMASVSPAGLGVLHTVGQILLVSGVLATAALALLTLEDTTWSIVAGMVGVLCLFGLPALVIGQVRGMNPGEAAQVVTRWSALTGEVMIAVAGLRLLYDIYLHLTLHEERRRWREERTERGARDRKQRPTYDKLLARCWEMPFCHEAVRELCPAFKAKRTCWRGARGCMCDPDLIETMLHSRAPTGGRRGVRGTEAAYIRADLEADVPRRPSERTIPCIKCPIYTEHQRRKFAVISPLVALTTLVLLFVFYPQLANVYSALAQGLARLVSGMALGATSENPEWWRDYLDNPSLRGIFVVILGLFVLAWVLRVAEWLVLEKKKL